MLFGMRSFRIGRVFGIEIEVHSSWIFIFALVFFNFVSGGLSLYPLLSGIAQRLPAPTTTGGWIELVAVALVATFLFFSSVLLHELSHSLVGRRYGVEIKRITLFLFGGLAQMTGEARDAKSEFFMAAAGPGSSLVIGAFFGILYAALNVLHAPQLLVQPALTLAFINVLLAVFNLVPGFPLDGGRVFRSLLWLFTGNMERSTRVATRGGQVFAGLLMAGGGYLAFSGDLVGFWYILIGLFLWNAAGASYQQMELTQALAGVNVGQIMTHGVITAPADVSLQELVNEYFLKYRFGRFPLVRDGKLVGTVTLAHVREISQDAWAATKAAEVAHPVTDDDFIDASAPAFDALGRMANKGTGQLFVREGQAVTGIVTRSDVMRALRVRQGLGHQPSPA